MSRDLEVVANAIARQMLPLTQAQDPNARAMFVGLGAALSICFTRATGKSSADVGEIAVLRWALGLSVTDREAKPLVVLQ